jgi:hypothetical protein
MSAIHMPTLAWSSDLSFFLLQQATLEKLCNNYRVQDLEFLTGLMFEVTDDVMWPFDLLGDVKCCKVGLRMNFDNSPMRHLKFFIHLLEQAKLKEKRIMYTNHAPKCCNQIIQSSRSLPWYMDTRTAYR